MKPPLTLSSKTLFGLYVHWPYCLSKCPYCDFASQVPTQIHENNLLEAYKRDLRDSIYMQKRPLTSLFFGGGTPSLMSPQMLENLLTTIQTYYTFDPHIEITMEANPDAITPEKMKAFADLGVTRLSLGVQALNEPDLRFLGRRHTLQTALARIAQAQKYFKRLNIDLIYARPNQTPKAWAAELKQALCLGPTHYSLYQLTIEENTPFARRKINTPPDKTARALYLTTEEIMEAAGMGSYEVSNYAKAGHESIHNLTYWLGGDYIGIGPAAHGRLGLTATQNLPQPDKWMAKSMIKTPLSAQERFEEKVLMGLRLTKHPFSTKGLSLSGINEALKKGWITQNADTITPTTEGILMLNQLILLVLP